MESRIISRGIVCIALKYLLSFDFLFYFSFRHIPVTCWDYVSTPSIAAHSRTYSIF